MHPLLLWLHRQGTYKDSTLTVTKQASELLLPVGWDLDPTEKFSFPKGTETSFHSSFLVSVLVKGFSVRCKVRNVISRSELYT